jgi:hypothetical protein
MRSLLALYLLQLLPGFAQSANAQVQIQPVALGDGADVTFHFVNNTVGGGLEVDHFVDQPVFGTSDVEWAAVVEHPISPSDARFGLLFKLRPSAIPRLHSLLRDSVDVVMCSRGHTFNIETLFGEPRGYLVWDVYPESTAERWFRHIIGTELLPADLLPID